VGEEEEGKGGHYLQFLGGIIGPVLVAADGVRMHRGVAGRRRCELSFCRLSVYHPHHRPTCDGPPTPDARIPYSEEVGRSASPNNSNLPPSCLIPSSLATCSSMQISCLLIAD